MAQDISVQGNVKDEKGESLIGVSIQVKGTTIGNITDIDGNYTIAFCARKQRISFLLYGIPDPDNRCEGK